MMLIDCPLCGGRCRQEEKKEEQTIRISCGTFHRSFCIGMGMVQPREQKERNQLCNLLFEHCIRNRTKEYFYDTGASAYAIFNQDIFVNLKALMKQYPENILDKIDRIIQNLAVLYPEVGEQITIDEELSRAFFAERTDRSWCPGWITTMTDLGYLKESLINKYCLTAKAWQRIDELRTKNDSAQAFMAMAFRDETKLIRAALHTGIEKAGYNSIAIDEKEHNNQIVPEIFAEIDKSRFLVMDVTYPNYGAYYEAGYALGKGKQVIVCCKKDAFEHGERPHFDIAQKSMIIWETEEDLINRLKKRIEATIV